MTGVRKRRRQQLAGMRLAGWTVVACLPFRGPRVEQAVEAPAAVPAGLFRMECHVCEREVSPLSLADVVDAAGEHDDEHHQGEPVAEIHPADRTDEAGEKR